MKKYLVLSVLTVVLLVSFLYAPSVVAMFLPQINVVTMKTKNYKKTISANGIITEKSQKNIALDFPIVPKAVFFEVGDHIQKDDVIATVDHEKTIAAIQMIMKTTPEFLPKSLIMALAGSSEESSAFLSRIPSEISSPATGKISMLDLTFGITTNAGSAGIISTNEKLFAKLSVHEADIAQVKNGQKVTLTGSAFGSKSYSGIVDTVYPAAKKQLSENGTETMIDVLVSIQNPNRKLKSGLSVNGMIIKQSDKKIDIVPYEAISQDHNGTEYVYIYKMGRALRRDIVTGVETAEGIEIKSGVDKHDFIVYDSQNLDGKSVFVTVGAK